VESKFSLTQERAESQFRSEAKLRAVTRSDKWEKRGGKKTTIPAKTKVEIQNRGEIREKDGYTDSGGTLGKKNKKKGKKRHSPLPMAAGLGLIVAELSKRKGGKKTATKAHTRKEQSALQGINTKAGNFANRGKG